MNKWFAGAVWLIGATLAFGPIADPASGWHGLLLLSSWLFCFPANLAYIDWKETGKVSPRMRTWLVSVSWALFPLLLINASVAPESSWHGLALLCCWFLGLPLTLAYLRHRSSQPVPLSWQKGIAAVAWILLPVVLVSLLPSNGTPASGLFLLACWFLGLPLTMRRLRASH